MRISAAPVKRRLTWRALHDDRARFLHEVASLGASFTTSSTMDGSQVTASSLKRTFPALLEVMADVARQIAWLRTHDRLKTPVDAEQIVDKRFALLFAAR